MQGQRSDTQSAMDRFGSGNAVLGRRKPAKCGPRQVYNSLDLTELRQNMVKHKVLFGALLICFSGLGACGHTGSQHWDYARDNLKVLPLKAEIKLVQTAVKNHQTLPVSTTLINSGSKVWMLEVWACGNSYRWVSDNPSVFVIGESCLKNSVSKIYLKPGQTFEKAVPVRVEFAAGKAQPESLTFRLGFKDPTCWSAQGIPPSWSNAVTVSVTR